MALPILVHKDEGLSFLLAGPPDLAVFLRDLDTNRRAKSETELVLYRFAESLVTDGMTICLMTWFAGKVV